MTDSEKIKRFGIDKIAFLALLIISVLCAKLLISSRTGFKLSKPFSLKGTGLSVSIPQGGGFQPIADNFIYEDNEFRLGCVLRAGRDSAISAHWQYFVLPIEETASERFTNNADALGGKIEYTKTKQVGELNFEYAKIIAIKSAIMLISGSTTLPDGRTLVFEVAQRGKDFDMIDKIFETVIASVKFNPENPLSDGRKFLADLKQNSLIDIAKKQTEQNYYYIEDFTGKKLGFSTDAVGVKPDPAGGESLVAAALYFLQYGMNSHAEQDMFGCDANMHTFKWGNSQNNLLINRETQTSIELDNTGTVTIQKRTSRENFTMSGSMLPSVLFDYAITGFLRSSFDSIMIDMISPDKTIKPIIIKKKSTESAKDFQITAAFAVEINFVTDGSSVQTIYLDEEGKMLLSEVQQSNSSYRFRKAEKQNVIIDFPNWSEKIEQIETFILTTDKK